MQWSICDVLCLLEKKEYVNLCEKRLCKLDGKDFYLNSFEYCVFSTTNICQKLSYALHSMGFVCDDVLAPFVSHLASVKGFNEQLQELNTIPWTNTTLLALVKRPDASRVLRLYGKGINGFEFALHDPHLSKCVGKLIYAEHLQIRNLISYNIFCTAPKECIKRLFCM